MNFTKDDIQKIKEALDKYGIKDTELQDANTPISLKDLITIIQNNTNKKITIREFIQQLLEIYSESFINLTDKYGIYINSLEEAISQIPSRQRKEGLIITFLDNRKQWKLYQFQGDINQFNNPNLWIDLFNVERYTIKSFLPDEEDLTSSYPDENGNSKLSLKDKLYDPYNFSGMGTKIIKKNVINILQNDGTFKRINYLSPDEFSSSNTIYIIKYDFDLNGKTIDLLDNCIIKYQGGSISNGIINNCAGYIGIRSNALIKGTKEQRPLLTKEDEGYQYFDTTYHKPIWWNGTQWIDGTNTPM